MKKFVKISSIESKFGRLEEIYKELISLIFLDAKSEKIDHRFTALNNASYKKVYESEPKDKKDNDWKKKYDPKSLKTLEYKPVKSKTK